VKATLGELNKPVLLLVGVDLPGVVQKLKQTKLELSGKEVRATTCTAFQHPCSMGPWYRYSYFAICDTNIILRKLIHFLLSGDGVT